MSIGEVLSKVNVVELRFGLDCELARVAGFSGATAPLIAVTDPSVILADLDGVSIGPNGFSGR